jgi:hypothetical protein
VANSAPLGVYKAAATMCGSERNAASTLRASSGFSKASAAVLLDAMASLRILSCSRLACRTMYNCPSTNNNEVISSAMPVVISVMALSLRRSGKARRAISCPPRR